MQVCMLAGQVQLCELTLSHQTRDHTYDILSQYHNDNIQKSCSGTEQDSEATIVYSKLLANSQATKKKRKKIDMAYMPTIYT